MFFFFWYYIKIDNLEINEIKREKIHVENL